MLAKRNPEVPQEVIDKIFDAIEKVGDLVAEKDPRGHYWDLRITLAYRTFRTFDIPRFRLEPADPQRVLADLLEIVDYVEQFPEADGAFHVFPETVSQDISERMQYLYGLAWSQLSREQYYDAAELFARRLRNSK